jgi:hypothetical protein
MAQDEKTIIRSLLEPKIKIDLLELEDLYTGTSDKLGASQKGVVGGRQYQNQLGVDYPFITINNYVFSTDEILQLTVNSTGFIPTIFFAFKLTKTDAFRSQAYPKDGDVLSIFIRAKNNAFKPIRNDFIITGVSSGAGGVENSGGVTTITGELFIPRIKEQVIKSYKGNSLEVLQNVCKELGLGFATNETSTNDSMSWLCAGSTWEEYIKEIASAAWKDTNSFYKVFIDVYYHLNFVNMNSQLEGDGQLAAGILDSAIMKDFYENDKNTVESSQTTTGKFLSTIDSLKGTNMYIQGYKTKNNSSAIHEQYGYKYNVQFFDMKSLKYWNLFVDPKTSDGAERKKIILKGRTFPKKEDEKKEGKSPSEQQYWKTQNQYVWKGIQSRNVHDKYTFAIAHNERNLLELQKLFLEVRVTRWNPNIYLGEKVPLVLITQADVTKATLDAQGEDAKISDKSPGEPAVLDQFYSGYYVVNGMSIMYSQDNSPFERGTGVEPQDFAPAFFQTFTMTRREWPTPLG